jgi:CheY-like chemotaxis protein
MDRKMVKEKAITGRILFIDDDRDGREVAPFNLRKAGYDVTAASDGQEGLALFSPEKFDLVVTDLKMPVVNGMEVLETVRRISPETPEGTDPGGEIPGRPILPAQRRGISRPSLVRTAGGHPFPPGIFHPGARCRKGDGNSTRGDGGTGSPALARVTSGSFATPARGSRF